MQSSEPRKHTDERLTRTQKPRAKLVNMLESQNVDLVKDFSGKSNGASNSRPCDRSPDQRADTTGRDLVAKGSASGLQRSRLGGKVFTQTFVGRIWRTTRNSLKLFLKT